MRTVSMQLSVLIVAITAGCSGPDDGAGGRGGGSISTGGTASDGPGGVVGTGGTTASGGLGSGGFGTGGSGECTNIRPTGTEWDAATCDQWATETSECNEPWMVDNNYCNESCGRCTSNPGGTGGFGNPGTGGTGNPGTGGTGNPGGTGGFPSTCSDSNLEVCNNQISTHCGYTFEYWKDSGSGCMNNTADGFSIEWNGINNLLARKGVRPGTANNVVHYSADYQPNGNSYLCVYGWTTDPLVEYYIIESYGNWEPPGQGAEAFGTVDSDGGTYKIFRTMRYEQPSIEGTKTFPQFWSVRTQKRTSGSVTVGNHFSAWKDKGLDMGNLYEVSMTVEGYQSSGSATVQMSID